MLEGFRRRLGLAYAGLYFRKQKDTSTRFSSAVSRSRRALVLFPESPIDAALTLRIVEYLHRRFAPAATMIIVREDLRSSLPDPVAARAQFITHEDLTSLFTPRSSLIRKLKSSTFDVAFDLNREFALTSAFLCKASSAPLRISFEKVHADAFYNLQVKTRQESPAGQAYEQMLRCLDMF